MAEFNPLQSLLGGVQGRQKFDQINAQQNLAQAAAQPGFNSAFSPEMQQVAAFSNDPASGFLALSKQKQQSFFDDAQKGLSLAKSGKWDQVMGLAQKRLKRIGDGDTSDTMAVINAISNQDFAGATQLLQSGVDAGIQAGALTDPLDREFKQARIDSLKQKAGPKPLTDFQAESLRLRKMENEQRSLDRKLRRETNELKQQELENKIATNNFKLDESKKKSSLAIKNRNIATKSVVNSGNGTIDLINSIRNHPGFSSAVGQKGFSSGFGILDEPKAGTEAAGAAALIETLESKNFLTSVTAFKQAGGTGSLSDAEGKKLAAAISSLSRNQSEIDFNKSLDIIEDIITGQVDIAKGQLVVDPDEQLNQPLTATGANGEKIILINGQWVPQ